MNLPEEYLLSHVEFHDDGEQSYSIISDDNVLRDKAEQLDRYLKVLGKGKSLPLLFRMTVKVTNLIQALHYSAMLFAVWKGYRKTIYGPG